MELLTALKARQTQSLITLPNISVSIAELKENKLYRYMHPEALRALIFNAKTTGSVFRKFKI